MIITFSGTGNSFWIALLLQNKINEPILLKLQDETLTEPLAHPALNQDKTIIWVFPTYSWGIPPVILRYIKANAQRFNRESVHHLVTTCGDDTGNLSAQWRKVLREKGLHAGGIWSVQMPNTYVLMKGFDTDPLEVEKAKLAACEERVDIIAHKLQSGFFDEDIVKGKWKFIKTSLIYPWFVKHAMSPRPFHANNRCISCGLCEQQCPTRNIRMEPQNDPSARPFWDNNCAMCLRCYHHCPAKAIEYGNKTKGKGQYKILKFISCPGLFS